MLAVLGFVALIKSAPDTYSLLCYAGAIYLAFACCLALARQCRAAEADAHLVVKLEYQHVESESEAVLHHIPAEVR